MRNRKVIYFVLASLFVLSLVLGGIVFVQRSQALKVVFLDVGQGDAILIEQGSSQVLIDGGRDGKLLLEKLGRYIPFWDRQIEAVIATHPDADHIGGLVDAIRTYTVQNFLETNAQSDSQTFQVLQNVIRNQNISVIEPQEGVAIKFPEGAELDVLYPFGPIVAADPKNTNQYSVVAKLATGQNKFLFTGDLPREQEAELIKNNIDVAADVLKVGHHGSKYSTSAQFLDAVKPETAIISVGKNNTYGHPNQEILDRLKADNIKILRTDESGDIAYNCQNIKNSCVLVPH